MAGEHVKKRRRKPPHVLRLGKWCGRRQACSPAQLSHGGRLAPARCLSAEGAFVSRAAASAAPLLSCFPVGSANWKAGGRAEGSRGEGQGTSHLPLLPGLSGGSFAVLPAQTPAGRPSLRAAGWSGLQRVRVPAPCSCGGLLLSLVPSPLSIHCLSSPLLHGLCAQSPILNRPHSKDLERLLFPGRPGWLGGSHFGYVRCAQKQLISGGLLSPLLHTEGGDSDHQKLSEPGDEPDSDPLLAHSKAALSPGDGPHCWAGARPHFLHLDATACQTRRSIPPPVMTVRFK